VAVLSAVAVAGLLTVAPGASAAPPTTDSTGPLVIGHRGASGYRPEHTLASYELAARMGADFVEPDLVITADGVLVARHEPEISGTTDVADHPEFVSRRTTKSLDGAPLTGWFVEDFTLAEIKTLRAKERLPAVRQENTIYDRRFEIPTFDEVLELRKRLSKELGRELGVYPETKHPTYFQAQGRALEGPLVRALERAGLNRKGAPVFVQSFETTNLKALYKDLKVPLVQLLSASGAPFDLVTAHDPRTYADLTTPAGLADIATYADGIGPDKNQVIPRDAAGNLGAPSPLVGNAHAASLIVHPYTFRSENQFLPTNLRSNANPADYGNVFAEYAAFFAAGVDGVFSDQADTAVEARRTR
jgi:glycerophosphoryl diester phosphodiesterase